MRNFVAVDIETSGLDPNVHEVIEVGLVIECAKGPPVEVEFSLPFDLSKADPTALHINGWGERPFPALMLPEEAVDALAPMLDDVHLVGKNPHFDAAFLAKLFEQRGVNVPWHHRLVDVGSLAWGWYNGVSSANWPQPPDVKRVAELIGIETERCHGRHRALYDARWAHRVFRKIVPR